MRFLSLFLLFLFAYWWSEYSIWTKMVLLHSFEAELRNIKKLTFTIKITRWLAARSLYWLQLRPFLKWYVHSESIISLSCWSGYGKDLVLERRFKKEGRLNYFNSVVVYFETCAFFVCWDDSVLQVKLYFVNHIEFFISRHTFFSSLFALRSTLSNVG